MSFPSLTARLAALQETTRSVQTLITRLANLEFAPGSVPLDLGEDEDDVAAELSAEIHQTLKEQEEDLELLEQEVEDLPVGRTRNEKGREREVLIEGVKRAKGEIKEARTSFRRAQISAKASLTLAQRQERSLLVASLSNPSPSSSTASLPRRKPQSNPEESKQDATVSAASSVTLALRRTHTLLSSELSRSQFAHDTLKESTAALAQLGESYSAMDTLLSSSKNLLGTLLKSQKSDTWYLETAFWILAATIGWLVFRRWVYGPAWWLVWLPMKMFYRAWMGVFVAVGLRGSGVTVNDGIEDVVSRVGSVVMSSTVSASVAGTNAPTVMGTEDETQAAEEGMIAEVGKIVDESQKEGRQGGAEEAEAPNPKKRMWEEEKEAVKEEQRQKDEL